MLIFIAIWLALIAVTFPVGLAILRLMDAQCFERSGERFVISVWLGTVLLADGLLAVSLFQPLSLATGGLLAAVLVGAALVVKRVRSEIRTAVQALYLKMSPIWSLGFIALLATVAYVATSGVNLYDAHLYHFQVIQWLSQVGVVPGLALIHNRFSFTSSWFAIAAPFNTGILETRVSALTGGFALLLITLQVFISFTHLLESPKRSQDWFVVAAAFIYLPFLMHSTLVVSPSPDLPAIALIVLVAWTMLVTGGSPGEPGLIILSPRLIPVLLAAGAMAIKLSAAVLLPIAVLFYALEQRRLRLGSLITASLVGIILILPVLSFGLIASGCPLYPSPTLCQDLPWSVGREEAKMISGIIHIWPRWGGPPPETATAWNWILPWLQSHLNATLLIAASLAALGLLVTLRQHIPHQGFYYAGMVGLLGTAFVLYSSPSLRFGLGYFCVLPALAIALVAPRYPAMGIALLGTVAALSSYLKDNHEGYRTTEYSAILVTLFAYLIWLAAWFSQRQKQHHQRLLGNLLMAIAFSFLSLGATLPHVLHSENPDRGLLPPQMPELRPAQRTRHRTRGVKYISPANPLESDLCRAAPIPCTPYLTHPDITLRDRRKGIEGGFIRASLRNKQR